MEPGVDMLSLVLTAPQIAMALPQTMIDLFMRVAIPDPSGSVAVIHQTLAPMQGGESAPPLIFDVDALRDVHMDPNDDEGIWAALEELRCLKNRIFFNSLTTRAIERYRNDDPS